MVVGNVLVVEQGGSKAASKAAENSRMCPRDADCLVALCGLARRRSASAPSLLCSLAPCPTPSLLATARAPGELERATLHTLPRHCHSKEPC